MTVYDEIKKKFILPNAFDDWQDYRKSLTDIVLSLGGNNCTKSVLVLGAGRCNDIDIHRLCASFKNIILADCDTAAMNEALKGLTEHEAGKLHILELSLTGISENDLSAFCDRTLFSLRAAGTELNSETFCEVISSGIKTLKDHLIKLKGNLGLNLPKSDIVICNGVFSQLFSTLSFFVRSCAASLPKDLIPKAVETAFKTDEELKRIGSEIIPQVVDAILDSATEYAVFGNEYSETHPIEGALCCIEVLRKNKRFPKEIKLLWDFNRQENVKYEMLLQIVQ